MKTMLISVLALTGFAFAEPATASLPSPSTPPAVKVSAPDCCQPQADCCKPGAACCDEKTEPKANDCCAPGAACCVPGAACCK